jgi:hypothetical protein
MADQVHFSSALVAAASVVANQLLTALRSSEILARGMRVLLDLKSKKTK